MTFSMMPCLEAASAAYARRAASDRAAAAASDRAAAAARNAASDRFLILCL